MFTSVQGNIRVYGPCRWAVFTGSVDRRPRTRPANTGVQSNTRVGHSWSICVTAPSFIVVGLTPYEICQLLLSPTRRLCFCRCLFVCLSISKFAQKRICMKFSKKVGSGPANKRLNFSGDPDPDPDPYRYTGKACLGGGLLCLYASILYFVF